MGRASNIMLDLMRIAHFEEVRLIQGNSASFEWPGWQGSSGVNN